jgi:cholesterol oxidase
MTPFKHVTVLSGVGVGGGSLVYGNTLYVPHSDDFYKHAQWADLEDWRAVLAPRFKTAQHMLGVVPFVGEGERSSASRGCHHIISSGIGIGEHTRRAHRYRRWRAG